MAVVTSIESAIQELFFWQYSFMAGDKADNFSAIVFRLIQKAQMTPENMSKLTLGFPHEVAAWTLWSLHRDQDEFFAEHGHYLPHAKDRMEANRKEREEEEERNQADANYKKWMENQSKK